MKHNLLSLSSRFVLAVLLFTTACSKNADTLPNINSHQTNSLTEKIYNVKVTTIAGKFGIQGDADGSGSTARFWNPTKMVYDNRNDKLYVADGTVIRSIDKQNNVKTYLPFGKIGNYAEILDIDVTADSIGGSLYFTTKENDLYKIEPKGTSYKLTTVINRIYGGNEIGKLNTKDHFDLPHGLATGRNGSVYFFNTTWYTMHHIVFTSTAPFAGTVITFVGKPAATRGGNVWPFADGTGETATFGYGVTDMCADGKGTLYVADFRNDLVRKVTPDGVVKSLFQYEYGLGIDVDGPVSTAQANRVDQMPAKKDGTSIFFTTFGKGGFNPPALRVVRPGIDVSTLVGTSTTYGDGDGNTAAFGEIGGIATTADGKTIYVSEVGNKVIRKVTIQ
jgi:sugar lactone lactonase YvrE